MRIALILSLGLVVVGLRSYGQEKDKASPKSATAQARRDAAQKVYEESWQHYFQSPEDGIARWDDYNAWSLRWLQAERDLGRTKAEDIAAIEGHLKRVRARKEMVDKAVKDHLLPPYASGEADFFVLEAEDMLTAARGVAAR
ncbi:MAG TPA: hypothetical protein VGH74_08105 [Planctomycetaceae bacterium]